MRECLLLYVYKNEREFNIEILKEVYQDVMVFCTDRILVLDLSKIEWDKIFPAVTNFNTVDEALADMDRQIVEGRIIKYFEIE